MICAYDKSYLAAAQKNLARMLDYLVIDLHKSGDLPSLQNHLIHHFCIRIDAFHPCIRIMRI